MPRVGHIAETGQVVAVDFRQGHDNVNYLSHIILKGVAQFVKTIIIKPMLQTIEDHPNGRYDKVNEQSDSN